MPRQKRRTRLVSQDMKTGEFAYLDQLIRDGYYRNMWVLPKNYDPPQPVGPSAYLPLRPLTNYSPENVTGTIVIKIGEQDIFNPGAKTTPTATGVAGRITLGAS